MVAQVHMCPKQTQPERVEKAFPTWAEKSNIIGQPIILNSFYTILLTNTFAYPKRLDYNI